MQAERNVIVLLSETFGRYDKVIRRFSRSEYSHASISLNGEDFFSFNNRGFVAEHPHHMKRKCKNICISFSVTEEEYEKLQDEISTFQKECEKYRYSSVGVVLCFLHIPFKFKNKYFCSQFVAEVLAKAGIVKLKKNAALYLPCQILHGIEQMRMDYRVVCNAY